MGEYKKSSRKDVLARPSQGNTLAYTDIFISIRLFTRKNKYYIKED